MQSIEITVPVSIEAAESAVRAALSEQGFGVLTEIDVAATLAAKLGVEILGACNPSFAHRALELDRTVSLLLPCNVVLEAIAGGTRVSAVDPTALMEGPDFAALASEATAALRAALERVASDAASAAGHGAA
jgi:uncharacterized protein (DUF302 family)